ncbi:MAG: metallophosphoesterase [Pseudomonadota bacterium]
MTTTAKVRVAAVGDLHVTRESLGRLQPLLAPVNDLADVLILRGDLTAEEADVLVRELAAVRVPMLAVLGNHDYESGTPEIVERALTAAGVKVLDGSACEIRGVGVAGVKGVCGGYGRATLGAWGERGVKAFVQEALDEARKLESALARLRTPRRVAVLHYSPIEGTVVGEPPVIYPFLGTSRLEGPLNRYPVDVIFHGHAHRGAPEGRTVGGIPVYTVAMPLLRRTAPEHPPFRVVELDAATATV